MDEFYLIAEAVSLYGKKGFVKIKSFSDFPGRFKKLDYVWFDFFGDMKKFVVDGVFEKKGSIYMKFGNFDSADDAEIILGKKIYVDEKNLIDLPEDVFFIHDLIGSSVLRNEKKIGIITDVLSLPANDVYVVHNSEGEEILIPALKDFIEKYDPENKVMILKPDSDQFETDED